MRAQGYPIDDALLKHVAPIHWNHINLTGDYAWKQHRRRERRIQAVTANSKGLTYFNFPFVKRPLVYLTPIFGGVVADRYLGKTKTITITITIGALLIAAGHFLMAFDVSFLIALSCLLIGVGFFKGNLASQISELYIPTDMRRADAYQIYLLFINAAVIIAPLIAGTLGEVYGWHYGFGAAGVGMLISLAIY